MLYHLSCSQESYSTMRMYIIDTHVCMRASTHINIYTRFKRENRCASSVCSVVRWGIAIWQKQKAKYGSAGSRTKPTGLK